MNSAVLDTSVILDIALSHHPGHAIAAKLSDMLKSKQVKIFLPMHAFFEITSAIMCEKRVTGTPLKPGNAITEAAPLRFKQVPIDLAFVHKYATGEAPDLKSGDMIFVVFAKAEGFDLVTADDRMYKEARRVGVSAYKPDEYLAKLEAA